MGYYLLRINLGSRELWKHFGDKYVFSYFRDTLLGDRDPAYGEKGETCFIFKVPHGKYFIIIHLLLCWVFFVILTVVYLSKIQI